LSHLENDYCVKDVGETVYEKIHLFAYDDSIRNEEVENLKLSFSSPGYYTNNEFYSNSSHYTISTENYNADIVLYDAESTAFCLVSPGSSSCAVDKSGTFLSTWVWIIIVLLCLLLLFSIMFARKKFLSAKQAKREQVAAEEALKNEVLLAEEGLEAGTQIQLNPLAMTGTKHSPKANVTVGATTTVEEGENEVYAFNAGIQQFRPEAITDDAFVNEI
jgi:hypothetical protein